MWTPCFWDVVVLADTSLLVVSLVVVAVYVVLSLFASPVIAVSEDKLLCVALPDTTFSDVGLSSIPSPAVVLSAESTPDKSFLGDRHPNMPLQNTTKSKHIPRFQYLSIFFPSPHGFLRKSLLRFQQTAAPPFLLSVSHRDNL